jgi:hypothetical protein
VGSAAAGIEEQLRTALISGLAWAVSESNDEALWAKVRESATTVLTSYWREGELQGADAGEAFFVRCGPETMTRQDIEAGRLIVEVGIAPVAPAEFVTIRIEQMVAGGPKRPRFPRRFIRRSRPNP